MNTTSLAAAPVSRADDSWTTAGLTAVRTLVRLFWLSGEVVFALAQWLALAAVCGGRPDLAARSRWLQRACRRGLRVFQVTARIDGPAPARGLLVCNHLSYLDILVISAAVPCVFVSKEEVRRWPVFGWCAQLAGTLFLRRGRRADAARISNNMQRALEAGALIALFPEGTTSDGRDVLPFKSSLLEPVIDRAHAVQAACIQYALPHGDVPEEVCYWKDMTLLPHLLNLLGKRGLEAHLCFAPVAPAGTDRKELARRLHAQVVQLKAAR